MINRITSGKEITRRNQINHSVPSVIKPYIRLARLDRPIGTWLLLLPCWWSISLGTENGFGLDAAKYFVLFGIGSIVMRGAGCTLNDIVDRKFDAQVARTSGRPLPSGEISIRQALLFFCVQLSIGFGILMQFNNMVILLGIGSVFLVFAYPFAKRYTYWPQILLGLTFNWGALLGWTAVRGNLEWPAIILYAAGVFWTLGYDTIYAHQDKRDDILIGVKSLALKLGSATKFWVLGFYCCTLALITYIGFALDLANIYFLCLLPCGAQLLWQAHSVDINDPTDCQIKFKSNRNFAFLLLIAILAGNLIQL